MSFLINQYIQNVAITRHLRMLSLETLRAFFINQLINHPFKSFLSTGAMNGSEMKNFSELCDGTGKDLINSKEKCLKTELLLSVFIPHRFHTLTKILGRSYTLNTLKKINPQWLTCLCGQLLVARIQVHDQWKTKITASWSKFHQAEKSFSSNLSWHTQSSAVCPPPLTPSAADPQASSPSPPPPSPPCPWRSTSRRWRRTTSWSCGPRLQPAPPRRCRAAPGSGSLGTGRRSHGRASLCRARLKSGRWWGRRGRWVSRRRWSSRRPGQGGGGWCHPSARRTAQHHGWRMLWWGRLAVPCGAADRRTELLWQTRGRAESY